MKERESNFHPPSIPGYLLDSKGTYYRDDEFGRWRILDTERGQLIAFNKFIAREREQSRKSVIKSGYSPTQRWRW